MLIFGRVDSLFARFIFQTVRREHRSECSCEKDCECCEYVNESLVIRSLSPDGLCDEYESVKHSQDRECKDESKTDSDEDDEPSFELFIC